MNSDKTRSSRSRGTKEREDSFFKKISPRPAKKPKIVEILMEATAQTVYKPPKPSRKSTPKPIQQRSDTPSPMLKGMKVPETPLSHAFRHIHPTWRNYIYYADQAAKAGDEEMQRFMKSYAALPPREQRSIMPESLCDLSGVSAADLVGSVSRELWTQKQAESTITASMLHPKVIESTGLFGSTLPDNNRDRELFLRATGTLPDKKGTSIVINNTPQSNAISLPSNAAFRPMEQSVIEMSKLLDEPDEPGPIAAGVDSTDIKDKDLEDGLDLEGGLGEYVFTEED